MTTSALPNTLPSYFLESASDELRLGRHSEASRLLWEAATAAIRETRSRIGWMSERHLYADVMDILSDPLTRERASSIYSSMLLLRENASEDYDLGDDWIRMLEGDIHELIEMLESVR